MMLILAIVQFQDNSKGENSKTDRKGFLIGDKPNQEQVLMSFVKTIEH